MYFISDSTLLDLSNWEGSRYVEIMLHPHINDEVTSCQGPFLNDLRERGGAGVELGTAIIFGIEWTLPDR